MIPLFLCPRYSPPICPCSGLARPDGILVPPRHARPLHGHFRPFHGVPLTGSRASPAPAAPAAPGTSAGASPAPAAPGSSAVAPPAPPAPGSSAGATRTAGASPAPPAPPAPGSSAAASRAAGATRQRRATTAARAQSSTAPRAHLRSYAGTHSCANAYARSRTSDLTYSRAGGVRAQPHSRSGA